MVKNVSEDKVVEMENTLCNRLLNGKEQRRDIVNIALKTIISEISNQSVAQHVIASLSPLFIRGITSGVSVATLLLLLPFFFSFAKFLVKYFVMEFFSILS